MTTATRISEPMRVDRLDTGERQLVRDLVVDVGQPLALGSFESEYVEVVDGVPRLTVPKGFVTDFSSIPAVFRPFYRFSTVDLAGCCHDLAYRIQMPRQPADRIWEIVATSGSSSHNKVDPVRGRLGYYALRIGGMWAYCSNATKPMFTSARHDDAAPG